MATRRTATKVEIPVPNGTSTTKSPHSNENTTLDRPPPHGTPFLPTSLEALLLAIYPTTLLLGSLFSSLHPAARAAPYNPHAQSYDPAHAPSYFAKKGNAFNVYFVKIGWFWVTCAFVGLVGTHGSFRSGKRGQGGSGGGLEAWGLGRRRIQALVRYACVTAVWVGVTQWFFGPPIIDRSFRWTGGQCEAFYGSGDETAKLQERAEMGDAREVFTHAACKAIGGQWKGGHDISGHVFLLILGSAMLWLEILPTVLKAEGLREARRVVTGDGLVRSAALEAMEKGDGGAGAKEGDGGSLSAGIKGALVVVGLSWWMLLMTAAYFHTWFEKFTGLTVAFTAVWAVYFLPRVVPVLRRVVGMPGV